ncbi:MAG: 50S ribosomal protein L25 [Candidatus Omnitrophica bacterium]|nr:50S ribosomal protein L25 [Candidatus Omnitrophota bacterium]MDE2010016.1 50S ribosomal protein L25 [Candidatus Omnitrophota bacterium]MDE2215048.1 50S ribosomal protein L25 [Candidatus Omnitrophota bacterium]MDE2231748.1 50S ribosomal protein L25 [Candidatus Omnitrophota bacterium]
MEQINFDVQIRKNTGSSQARRVRRSDLIPGIIYGAGAKPTTIQADRKAYDRVSRIHAGESLIYHLNLTDEGKKVSDFPAIIKDVQLHPVTDEVIHIDFNRISLDQEIEIKVKIIPKGEAVGVKRDGGTLEHLMWELDIVCLPTNIPHHLEADITNLGVHDSIHVKDLALPPGVRTKHDPESVVITVAGSMREETAPAAAEGEASAAGAEPEVLKEKKKEETAEGAAKKPEAAKKEEAKK